MVKIAIAGGSSNIAQEVLDVLVDTRKHEIVLLSRKNPPLGWSAPDVTWVKVNYEDPEGLVQALQGVHTLLCFIVTQSDPGSASQKNLIDAAVKAGVKRYAPSEWVTSSFEYMPWYDGKAEIREYLYELNKSQKVLEYCLFQPGMFVNYYAEPYKTSKHLHLFQNQIDFNNRRAIILEGGEDVPISLTTVHDFCNVVARAVEYEAEWPLVGGMRGDEVTVAQLIAIGEKVRGAQFSVEKMKFEDLKAGVVKSTWLPKVEHPAISLEDLGAAAAIVSGVTLGMSAGAFRVSDEWNRLLPGLGMTRAEDFLENVWRDKP